MAEKEAGRALAGSLTTMIEDILLEHRLDRILSEEVFSQITDQISDCLTDVLMRANIPAAPRGICKLTGAHCISFPSGGPTGECNDWLCPEFARMGQELTLLRPQEAMELVITQLGGRGSKNEKLEACIANLSDALREYIARELVNWLSEQLDKCQSAGHHQGMIDSQPSSERLLLEWLKSEPEE